MRIIFGIAFLCYTTWSLGQLSTYEWHKGIVVTTDQDTISGEIKYNFSTNMISLVKNGAVIALSSHKLIYFEIYDEDYKSYREFYTIPYKNTSNYMTPILFELQYESVLSLLSRENIVMETSSMGYGYGLPIVSQPSVRYDFFFLTKAGKITQFSGSKKDLFRILGKKKNELQTFIKRNRLKTDKLRDLVRIIAFYNSI
ncbi:MAG: hypothetical protein CBB92_04775 [Flammeovirgaceae bacterium TMED32]|nr:MAG: hypothetical protein CBB92_04775 [Flammeovirgaceae bacterium TMED32]|tara:strand:+ start:94 stop:690 length:597 start_codon:yes stop_codon:yes gene_type:complete